jgi:ATP-dependent Clp protease adaptor protein ClpS
MSDSVSPAALPEIRPDTRPETDTEPGYLVVCWNDPVNFMDYVTHVFQTVFGWPRQKAEFHMRQVHQEGRSVLSRESLERAEFHVHELQKHTLHATLERET